MYRNALLCLVDAPPGSGPGGPCGAESPGARPPGPLRPLRLGPANGAPRARPLPPWPARARRHRAVWHPPHPRARLLAALAVLKRLRAAARHALLGGVQGASPGLPPPVPRVGQPGGGSPGPGGPVRPRQARQPSPHRPPPGCRSSRAGGPPGGPRHGSGPSISRPWRPGVQGTPTGRRASLNFAFSEQGREYAALSLNVEFSEIEGTKSPHPPTLCVLLSRASPG